MIIERLEYHARNRPQAPFLREWDASISFGELFNNAASLAACLQHDGVGYGDRVVLYLKRHSRHLTAYLAAMMLGAIPVHLYPQRKPGFVAFAAGHTGASLVISDGDALDGVQLSCGVLRYDETTAQRYAPLQPGRRHPVAYMMFTSGTTGAPKAVMTTQENVAFVTRTLIEIAGITEHDREIIVMPLGSTGGLGHFHVNLFLGNPVILLPYFFGAMDDNDMSHMLDIVEQNKITGFLSTPGMLARLAENHRDLLRSKCSHVRYLLANVTPMRESLVRDLMRLLPQTRFHTYYGLTEASRSVYHCYNDNPDKIASAGHPSPGVDIAIGSANAEGVGEVLIKGPNVMDGYWEMDDHGFNANGWFCSGDLGCIDEDGFLTIHGRLKENIRVDGLDCLPREMEEVLLEHPEVADCAVVGLPDPRTHQRVAAAVVPVTGADYASLPNRLCAHCSERLEFYKAPTRYALVETIPKTDLGKIKRDEVCRQLDGMVLTIVGE